MRIFKRKMGPDGTEDRAASYYVRFMVRGEVYLWSTKTNDATLARRRAKAYRDAIVAEQYHLADSMKARNTVPTFEDLFKEYDELPLAIDKHTRTKNKNGMRDVMAANGFDGSTRIDQLSASVGVTYQQWALAEERSIATINSRLRAAKSLFSRRAMIGYRLELPVGPVDDFKRVPSLREVEKLPVLPDEGAIARAHATLPATPDIYRAFLLAAHAGMRAGEIVAARWDWLDGDVIYIGGKEFHAKSRRWRPVRLHPDVLAALHVGAKDPIHIAGEYPAKTVRRLLPAALKALGFGGQFPVHAARRWAGSVVADAQGIYHAQNMLGHSSPAVTAKAYARQLNIPAPIPMVAVPA